ncbi:MAG TPA: glutathione S-transferase N-terminal domain-containing protein [Usitatibacter sp.]|nr:glutathione S-transferase N-terminal domain-containing protein [Usitatibacter sp.]
MYTLHYSPGSCSLIIHCLLEELGVPFKLQRVDVGAREHHSAEYLKLNPKGKVPVLETPDGPLTECVALAEYLCDRHDKEHRFLAPAGTWERARTLEQVAMLSTEVHNNLFNRFFHADVMADDPAIQAAIKARAEEKLVAFFREEDARLTRALWHGRDQPDLADFFFMVLARWGRWLGPSALKMPKIEPFFRRMTERPAVARAMKSEGILPFGA